MRPPGISTIAIFFGSLACLFPAAAGAQGNSGDSCLAPFAIPDRWEEVQAPPWNDSSTFDPYDPNPDIYAPADPSDPGTGYTGQDLGLQLSLELVHPGDRLTPGSFFAVALDGSRGAGDYRENIRTCSGAQAGAGDLVTVEPGEMDGPTIRGLEDLIDLDPNAYWANGRVVSDLLPSPRIVAIIAFDPNDYELVARHSGRNTELLVAKRMLVFIELIEGDRVFIRIVELPAVDPSQ